MVLNSFEGPEQPKQFILWRSGFNKTAALWTPFKTELNVIVIGRNVHLFMINFNLTFSSLIKLDLEAGRIK